MVAAAGDCQDSARHLELANTARPVDSGPDFGRGSSDDNTAVAVQKSLIELRRLQGVLAACQDGLSAPKRVSALEEQVACITASYEALLARCDDAEHLRSELQQTRVHLDAVLHSTSWRVTSPMRRASSKMPKVVRRLKQFVRNDRRFRQTAKWLVRQLRRTPSSTPSPVVLTPGAKTPRLSLQRIEPAQITPVPSKERLRLAAGRRIVSVGHVLPYPIRAGNEYRIHRMLDWLAKSGNDVLVVVCPLPGEEPPEDMLAQASMVYPQLLVCSRAGDVRHNLPDGSPLLAALGATGGRDIPSELGELGGRSAREAELLSITRTYCPDVLVELLLEIDRSWVPEVVVAEYIFQTRPFSRLRKEVLKVIDTVDVFSTMAEKVRAHGIGQVTLMDEAEEAAFLKRADVVIGIQTDETETLRRLVPERRVVNAGVDFAVAWPATTQVAQRPVVLLVASGNPMNVKGLRDFLRFCWPLVRTHVPDAEFHVVGKVGAAIEVVPAGVRVLGRLDALDEAYADARVVINPVVAGTGLKIKTVDALSRLRPIVCFPAGAEGVIDEARQFCHVVANWYEFSEQLAKLLRHPPTDQESSAYGKKLASVLAPARIYAELDAAIHEARS